MNISDNVLKEQLKNVYFLSGGAYGGKTTMAKLLEEKYGFVRYRQGDHSEEYAQMARPEFQPAISLDKSADWHGFFAREPKEYGDWLDQSVAEEAEFAIMDLIKLSQHEKVIADVCIPTEILAKITDKDKVALLFAPEEMTRKHYFDRADKDEVYRFIKSFPDGDELLKNVVEALHYNYKKNRKKFLESGFYYIERSWDDTVDRTLALIEKHFKLI